MQRFNMVELCVDKIHHISPPVLLPTHPISLLKPSICRPSFTYGFFRFCLRISAYLLAAFRTIAKIARAGRTPSGTISR